MYFCVTIVLFFIFISNFVKIYSLDWIIDGDEISVGLDLRCFVLDFRVG